ncbi:MAG: hypothetical protein TV42_01575 [Wolbachia endosymbiont of Dactylopius coccus]|nr:MAG: hypothetical protein TV42_01575 [Wolbachia endosymbiont of Dactylopius coccus]
MNFSKYVKNNALRIFATKVDINELIAFLQSNTCITKLSLQCFVIGKEGAKALASLTHLTELNFRVNNIGDEGAKALANGNLKNLTKLNLSCNRIGDKGAKALAEGNLKNLTRLDLSGNDFGEDGKEALSHNFKDSTFINLSYVISIDIQSKFMNALADLQEVIDSGQPSSELSEVQQISPSHSLSSLHSNDSDISSSQCR